MKNNIKKYLKALDAEINKIKPATMDALIEISIPGGEKYGHHYTIVKYMGALQGVRVYVTGRTKSHHLPSKAGFVYSIFKGVEKYEAAGFPIEYSPKN